MDCQEAKDSFSEYLDRRLPEDQVSSFERHLAGCLPCRQELEALRRTVSLIGSLDEIKPSSDFLGRVHEKIEKGKRGKRIWTWLFEPFKVKVPLEATALVLVSVMAFYLYQRLPEVSHQETMSTAGEKTEGVKEKPPEESLGGITGHRESYRGAESESKLTTELPQDKISPAPAFEARDEAAGSTPRPEIQEIVVDNVADYERRVKILLKKVQGRVLAQAAVSESGSLLTVELPRSRQAGFLIALKEELQGEPQVAKLQQEVIENSEKDVRKKDPDTVDRSGEVASQLSPSSRLRADGPMVTIRIRILPKK